MQVESNTEFSHLVPGGASVLSSIRCLGVLDEEHVGEGVDPGVVGDGLQEVAVDVEPAECGGRH